MEDITLRVPTADLAILAMFAERMGWSIDRQQSVELGMREIASGDFYTNDEVQQMLKNKLNSYNQKVAV